ncbi:MAG TPA: hypothetical protein VIY30_17670, partial [Burkholderiaceae bacterium]
VRRRRMADFSRQPEAGFLTLVRDADGLLDWQVDAGPSRGPVRRAARRGVFDPTPIDQVAFRPVTGSKVAEFLTKLDAGFNDRYGLFDLAGQRVDAVVPEGRVLLIVHGTFSKCDAIVKQLEDINTGEGRQLLAAARDRGAYKQVLLYEHPTLAVAPWLNALDLARAFVHSSARIDIVCHSRGGLVTRWWLETMSPRLAPTARVVFVGSPLMGTGLASPYRLRTALKLLTNLSAAMGGAGQLASLAMPMFAVVQGLATLLGSVTGVLARTPIADAAVALVPGLVAMSRYGPDGGDFIKDNRELEKLSYGWTCAPNGYFAVSSNFETEDVGWKFWQVFRNPLERIADSATDALFSGQNDLVVDTDSMSRMAAAVTIAGPQRRLDFGTNPNVHHLNYFAQKDTVAFIRSTFAF